MKIDVIKKLKKDAFLVRGEQAVKFIRDHTASEDLDEPWLTSRRLLMSFGFELILKSRVVSLSMAPDEPALEKELKNIGHDFTKFKDVLNKQLNTIGITEISPITENCYSYYVIKSEEGDIEVENLNDVRYKNQPRANSSDEHNKIIGQAKNILKISEKIRKENKNE